MTHPKEPEGMSDTPYDRPLAYFDGLAANAKDHDGPEVEMDRESLQWVALGICAEGRPAEFWKRLQPHQARALLAAAPRVASRWERVPGPPDREAWRRYDDGNGPAAVVTDWPRYNCAHWSVGRNDAFRRGEADTIEAAKSAADAALVAAGYILDDSEAST